jgi:tripartite-type tricarboxylate transporter receptor subunit TctC
MKTILTLASGALLAFALASPPLSAQTYPSKPVKIVAPFAPGGWWTSSPALWATG